MGSQVFLTGLLFAVICFLIVLKTDPHWSVKLSVLIVFFSSAAAMLAGVVMSI